MSFLDDFENYNVDDCDLVSDDNRTHITFVFEQDLTEAQISAMKGLFSEDFLPCGPSSKEFCLQVDDKEALDFLEIAIPCDIAKILAYVKFYGIGKMPIALFKSDMFLRNPKFTSREFWTDVLVKHNSTKHSQLICLNSILSPTYFCLRTEKWYEMDILTVEMIASHFFFNPIILAPLHHNLIVLKCTCSKQEIKDAFKTSQKIVIIDESQKVRMVTDKEETDIENLLKNEDVHPCTCWKIPVKSGNETKVYNLYIIIKRDLNNEGYYKIYAFVDSLSS